MSIKQKTAIVFGGTGFLGRQIVRELAAKGMLVKVATRVPERGFFLKLCGNVGQITPVACDYADDKSIYEVVKGSDFVVNCIGILSEKRKGDFARAHVDIPSMIAKACKKAKVNRFVHISIPGVENNNSRYARTKYEGEKAISKLFPEAVILRPSLVFGPDDDFFNKFAGLIHFLPILPLIGGGKTKFQPVYVGDVADAVMVCLEGKDEVCGQVYELGGSEVLTFKEIYELLSTYIQLKRRFMSLPWGIAKIQATFMGMLPNPLLTRDQVESLKTDFIVSDGALTLADLGITPTAMALILPTYLERYRSGGRFGDKKAA